MLEYASIHRAAVDAMTQRRDLRDFELMDYEWKIVGQLRDMLKVCGVFVSNDVWLTLLTSDSERRHNVLFTLHPQSCHCYTSHGSNRRKTHDILS